MANDEYEKIMFNVAESTEASQIITANDKEGVTGQEAKPICKHQVCLVMGCKNNSEFIPIAEQAWNLIDHDHLDLDEDDNKDNCSTNSTSKDEPAYGFMAAVEDDSVVDTNGTKPIHPKTEHVKDSLRLLLHALYHTLHAHYETPEQAEGWYEATKIKLWLSGLSDSSIFVIMYDRNKVSINVRLEKCGF